MSLSLRATTALAALTVLLPLGVACDPDGDGLRNGAERRAGTDKNLADTDDDRLSDYDELEVYGTDPLAWDTDGDGYADGDEITEGTDPLDAADVIYSGGWPYNWAKDDWAAVDDDSGQAARGGRVPRFQGRDQHGQLVDLYDFGNQGKPIIITVSAEWCGPCRVKSEWLAGNNEAYAEYNNVRRAVNRGDVLWITFLAEDSSGQNANVGVVRNWDAAYPHENVAVLVDTDKRFTSWMDLVFFPTSMWVNPDMTIQVYNRDDPTRALSRLSANLDEVLAQ